MSACSMKFFTWDLKLEIGTLTHFKKKNFAVSEAGAQGQGKVSAELHRQALGATHQLDPSTTQLPPRYVEPLSPKGLPYHRKTGETLEER